MSRQSVPSEHDDTPLPVPAGDFSAWLRQVRAALLDDGEMDVPCGDCIGCCSSSYFIHIKPQDREARARIPKQLTFPAPGLPKGHLVMGYDQAGLCPMLSNRQCSIYAHRPRTCRSYDCRVFAAAGIAAGDEEKAVINQRVALWAFSYPSKRDRDEHRAVQAAARFLREHAGSFPGGRVPDNPSQLALLAIKSYEVFLDEVAYQARSPAKLAGAVMEACRRFDAA